MSCGNPGGRNAEKIRKEMQVYFATFSDDLPARIDATYMKYAAVHVPSSKQCRRLSKLFYQAVNLMEDPAAIEKKLLKSEEEEASSQSFQDSSNEGIPQVLGGNEERGYEEDLRSEETTFNKVQSIMRRSGQPRNPGNANEVRKKIEANAIEFIQRAQQKFHKSIA